MGEGLQYAGTYFCGSTSTVRVFLRLFPCTYTCRSDLIGPLSYPDRLPPFGNNQDPALLCTDWELVRVGRNR